MGRRTRVLGWICFCSFQPWLYKEISDLMERLASEESDRDVVMVT